MNRPAAVDPHAATFADDGAAAADRSWRTPVSAPVTGPPIAIDPRADTLPSDGNLSGPPAGSFEIDPLLGRMLGHFRVDALIGRGGMGAVYRAWDTSLLRPVAIKVLLVDSVNARTRFLREARSQAQLRHPNVVPIHYVGESEGIVFLVMDLVEGESLTDLIRREGRLAAERALDIVDAVASALAAGHQAGLIHRDVKPSNILLERNGRAQLADFGLAKDVAAADVAADPEAPAVSARGPGLTRAGSIVGTPAYLAPEQAAGGRVDHRADMYALGASLFEAVTGAPPFDAPTPTGIVALQQAEVVRSPRALVGDLHPSVEKLVLRLLQKQPERRFATYEELRAAITRARTPPLIPGAPVPRLVAFSIDYLLFAFAAAALFMAVSFLLPRVYASAIAWAAAVVAASLLEWRLGGAGIGKRLMSLRAVDRYGLAPRLTTILARTALKAAGPALLAFGSMAGNKVVNVITTVCVVVWLVGLALTLGKKRLSLHDRLSRTLVVFAPAAPISAAALPSARQRGRSL